MALRWRQLHDPAGGLTWGSLYNIGLTIDSVSPAAPKPGEVTTIKLSNASATGKTVTLGGFALTLSSQDSSSITLTWPEVHKLGSPATVDYGVNADLVVTDGAETQTLAIQTTPADAASEGTVAGYTEVFGGPSVFDPPSGGPSNGITNGMGYHLIATAGTVVIDNEGIPTLSTAPASTTAELTIWDHTASPAQWSNVATIPFADSAPDTTPPAESVAAAVHAVNATSLVVDATYTDVSGPLDYYFAAVADGGAVPTAAQMRAGSGGAINSAGSSLDVASGVEAQATLSGLTESTAYDLYVMVDDDEGNTVGPSKFADQSTTAAPDTTAPTVSGPSILAVGNILSVPVSEAVQFGADGNGGFALTLSGGAASLTYLSGAGVGPLLYTISRYVAPSETGTLAYTQPGDGVKDLASTPNLLASFSGLTVGNASDIDVIPPVVVSATIDGDNLRLQLAEAVQFGADGNGGFALTMSGGAVSLSFASASASVLNYTLSREPDPETETGTLAYTQPGDGVKDLAVVPNLLASFSGFAVLFVGGVVHNDVGLRHNDPTLIHEDQTLRHNASTRRHNRTAA